MISCDHLRHQVQSYVAGALPVNKTGELPVAAAKVQYRRDAMFFQKVLNKLDVVGVANWQGTDARSVAPFVIALNGAELLLHLRQGVQITECTALIDAQIDVKQLRGLRR